MSDTVTVASKLPMDLVLHHEEPFTAKEPTPAGQIEVTRYMRTEKTVVIRGVSRPIGEPDDSPLRDGFALTHNVEKAFWDHWLEAHRDYAPIVNGALFAVAKPADAKPAVREHEKIKSGFEPANPDELPDEFKAGRTKISKASAR